MCIRMNNIHADKISVKLTGEQSAKGEESGKTPKNRFLIGGNSEAADGKSVAGIPVYKGKSKEETVSAREKQKFIPGGIWGFRDFDWK